MATSSQLKDEGNALFAQQKWKDAHAKYTQAIALDEQNAVLRANRAACSLNLKKFQEALADSKKASELDPQYAKAWARLATAQDRLQQDDSVESWTRAISCLPATNLTPAELKQKRQYESALKEARDRVQSKPLKIDASRAGSMPWDRAAAMKDELTRRVNDGDVSAMASSAWVIYFAHQEFEEGMQCLRALKKVPIPGPQPFAMVGRTDGLVCLSNGIIRDTRVFHLKDQNFPEMYNNQVMMEIMHNKAWAKETGDQVIEAAQKRQRSEGWDAVRPALSTTVRAWILRGFILGGLKQDVKEQLRWYGEALHVLEWGQRAWKDASREDRGTIFDYTFVRAVRSLHLEAYMQACSRNPGPNSEYNPERLLEDADQQLREIEEHPLEKDASVDPGFVSSFQIYPSAQALAMKGFYYKNLPRYERSRSLADIEGYLKKSAAMYLAAAAILPVDDEHHAWYLACGVNSMFKHGAPIKDTLPILEAIREARPQYKAIWENSQMAMQSLDRRLQMYADFETEARKLMEDGTVKMDSQIHPDWVYDD